MRLSVFRDFKRSYRRAGLLKKRARGIEGLSDYLAVITAIQATQQPERYSPRDDNACRIESDYIVHLEARGPKPATSQVGAHHESIFDSG